MPGRLVSTVTTRSPRRATASVVRPPGARATASNVQSAPEPGRPYVTTCDRAPRATSIAPGLFVPEDVGVIELDRRQQHDVRPVVQELRSLVEEGGVVFVALDDELGAGAEAPRPPEVERHATAQA